MVPGGVEEFYELGPVGMKTTRGSGTQKQKETQKKHLQMPSFVVWGCAIEEGSPCLRSIHILNKKVREKKIYIDSAGRRLKLFLLSEIKQPATIKKTQILGIVKMGERCTLMGTSVGNH